MGPPEMPLPANDLQEVVLVDEPPRMRFCVMIMLAPDEPTRGMLRAQNYHVTVATGSCPEHLRWRLRLADARRRLQMVMDAIRPGRQPMHIQLIRHPQWRSSWCFGFGDDDIHFYRTFREAWKAMLSVSRDELLNGAQRANRCRVNGCGANGWPGAARADATWVISRLMTPNQLSRRRHAMRLRTRRERVGHSGNCPYLG